MKILIADDHGVLREGLRAMLAKDPEMEVVGEAEDGSEAVRLAAQLRPDIVIMDITMPQLNGIEATRQIMQNAPATKVIILSMHTEGHIIKETLTAGACGYVVKASVFDELSRALRTVVQGEYYLSPCVSDVLVHGWLETTRRGAGQPAEELSSRERQILQLSAEGLAVKEIARQLHISPKTVHANRRRLMDKLGCSSLPDLTKYALSQGMTSIEF